jgi:hypothetical protein
MSERTGESFMKKWIGAAILAATLMFAGPATIRSVAASPSVGASAAHASKATDLSARRHYRHYHRYGYRRYYRPYYPSYYGRPYYYQPYPYYAPPPFTFGFGFGPWWW